MDSDTESESSPLIEPQKSLPSYANPEISTSHLFCKVYKRRWYILFIYCVLITIQSGIWIFWGPIQESCKVVFGWENWHILLLSVWGPIAPLLVAGPFGWIMFRKGLRPLVLVTSFALCIGKGLQIIPFANNDVRTAVINVGQMIAMTSGFMCACAPAVLSAVWFPPHERVTATTVAMLAGYFGSALSFALGPSIVPDPHSFTPNATRSHSHPINITDADKHLMETRITDYMYGQLGVVLFVSFCLLIYFPSKPPLPPSLSSLTRRKEGIKRGLTTMAKDPWFWVMTLVFAVSYGSYIGWVSVLDVAVAPFGVTEKMAGLLGCVSTLAGVVSGILAARCADLTRRHTKLILVVLFSGATLSQLLFTITCERYIPYSKPLLYVCIIASGLFFTGTTPLFFELLIEYVYPVSDGLATCNLFLWGSVFQAVLLLVFMFPRVDVGWMNWVTVAGCAICAPVLLVFKEKYTRLDLDLSNRKTTTNS